MTNFTRLRQMLIAQRDDITFSLDYFKEAQQRYTRISLQEKSLEHSDDAEAQQEKEKIERLMRDIKKRWINRLWSRLTDRGHEILRLRRQIHDARETVQKKDSDIHRLMNERITVLTRIIQHTNVQIDMCEWALQYGILQRSAAKKRVQEYQETKKALFKDLDKIHGQISIHETEAGDKIRDILAWENRMRSLISQAENDAEDLRGREGESS